MLFIKRKTTKNTITVGQITTLLTFVIFVLVMLRFNFSQMFREETMHYPELARSFAQAKLDLLIVRPSWTDVVSFSGKNYWPLGPFPAVLLVPFVVIFEYFDVYFFLGYVNLLVNMLVFYLAFKLSRKLKFSNIDSVWMAIALVFASVYHITAYLPWSWYYTHTVAMFLGLFGLNEYLGKRRYWLIGMLFSLLWATRFTAGIGIIFFVVAILGEKKWSATLKFRQLVVLLVPTIVVGGLLLAYNYFRFGDFFDNGYRLVEVYMLSVENGFTDAGLFGMKYVINNFYLIFLSGLKVLSNEGQYIIKYGPIAVPHISVPFPGTSFFVVSPLFIYILKPRKISRDGIYALIAIAAILPFLLTYFWYGWKQVGPRYTIDFLPYAFLLLLYVFKGKLGAEKKFLIVVSALLNIYLTIPLTYA